MKKNSKNNYYVMDAHLENQKEDEFRHKEISDCILNLITNTNYPTPYNIALIGKWGLGKSSILNILEECLKKEDKNYKVILINAWKYESESLKKVFLKEIYEKVSNTKISYLKELETKLNKIFAKVDSENNKKNKKNKFMAILPYFAFSLILSLVWQITGYVANKGKLSNLHDYKISYLICKYFYFYFENIFFTLSTAILPTIITKWLNKESNIFPIQIDYQTDYEVLLKNLTKEQTETDKFIIIIDDLDRLSTKKMVEALDVLKTLMEIDKCVFIVPFDDSILKDALNKQIVSKFDNDQQVIESEFILDKLFQFRFYVPPLISSDMKDYTLNIIKTKAKDLYEMLTEDELEEIVKMIFMYDGLKTPRQIKKIINTFANNMLLFTSRVQGGKIDSSLLNKDGKLMIAKLSVLQSDFNDFYDDLFNDSNICEEMLKVNKKEYKEYKDIPKIIQKYFVSKNNEIIIKEPYDKLINFLSRTSYIKSPDISVYLCCNQDRMSFLNGSEFNRKLLNSMPSMNFTSMNSIIQENKQVDIKSIFIEYLERDASYNLPMLIVSIMNVKDFEFDDDKFNEKYTSFISKVYNSVENFDWKHFKNINLEQLLKLKSKTNNEIVNSILNDYFVLLYKNVDSNEIKHNNIFEILIAHLNELNNLNQSTIKNYLYSLCQKDFSYIKQLNNFSITNDLLKTYFGESLYKLIVNELNEDDSDDVDSIKYTIYSELLTKMYDSLKNDACIGSINKDIINLLDDSKNICLCKNIITSNAHLFNLEEKNSILNKVIVFDDDNELEQQYDIINALSIDITTENEEFQDKIITFINNDYDIENIMNNINNYKLIDKVVKELNSKIYLNSKIDTIYKNNIEKFDRDQLDELVDILVSTINIDTYKEGRLSSITNIIHNDVYIDELVKCFTNDELIKNEISANEMISIIKSDDDIEESIIDDYIKRIIELLPTNNKNMRLLAKMIDYISYDNLKLLITTTTTDEVINNLEKEELKSLFSVYKETRIDENNVEDITSGLNTLLYTDIHNQVVNYMISKKIIIDEPIEFIFESIDDLDELKNYSNLKEILKIDEEFIDFLIEKLKTTEYTIEQLKYLITLDESILSTVKERLLKFNADNKIALLNIQKIIVSNGNENDLTQFQLDILKSNDNELIISILMDLLPIKNTINRKQIKIAIETLLNSEDTNELLAEKIENFANNNHYRKFKVKKEKQTTS